MTRLLGRTALLTGAAGGIGAAAARVFAREGAQLVLVDIDAAGVHRLLTELEESGTDPSRLLGQVADVSSEPQVVEYVGAAVERFGGIDVLYNLAGVLGPLVPLTELTEKDFDHVLAVNTKGTWLNLKHVAARMRERGRGGSVINASANLVQGALPLFGGYLASEHAIVGLTQTAACELADDGIRVNAVMIGPTDAPMSHEVISTLFPDVTDTPQPDLPMHRRASPTEIAEVVAFLASDAASYMTGACVPVDGGFSAR